MTNKELLEKAARACGYKKWRHINDEFQVSHNHNFNEQFADWKDWTSLDNSGDFAEMNVGLRNNTTWYDDAVLVESFEIESTIEQFGFAKYHHMAKVKDHNNDPLAAWRYASTVVAGMMGERG